MNPSVEDAEDEAPHMSDPPKSDADRPQFSWTELLSRHESVLSSHLEMLNSVRAHVKDDAVVRTLSGMVEKTNRLIFQFKVVKKQVNKTNPFSEMSSSASQTQPSRSTPPRPIDPKRQRKRSQSRTESDGASEPEGGVRISAPKRIRAGRSIPGEDEDVRNVTPISMETEDISEEVNRRLRIKEERRKKKNCNSGKRKWESVTSSESNSPRDLVVKRRTKRVRLKYSTDEEVNIEDLEGQRAGNGVKKRESGYLSLEDKRGLKRIKMESSATTTS